MVERWCGLLSETKTKTPSKAVRCQPMSPNSTLSARASSYLPSGCLDWKGGGWSYLQKTEFAVRGQTPPNGKLLSRRRPDAVTSDSSRLFQLDELLTLRGIHRACGPRQERRTCCKTVSYSTFAIARQLRTTSSFSLSVPKSLLETLKKKEIEADFRRVRQ